jgi:hypothetical protein
MTLSPISHTIELNHLRMDPMIKQGEPHLRNGTDATIQAISRLNFSRYQLS